ncbi:MAG: hypothetical protein IPO15_14770 [Anaerolineae bacterium]|uniref:hypothetical protein n=1 Tax=Candidatus Amarolinea dominans TaxID=3140696 RepID=UPI003136FC92|nr:hypothetical protein [Anaerolineae bacterium]
MLAALDGRPTAVLRWRTRSKGSAPAIARMHWLGLQVVMITGDNRRMAGPLPARWASAGAGGRCCRATRQRRSRPCSKRGRLVAMVGDGINNAPAPRRPTWACDRHQADVAMETAGVTLMSGDLRGVPRALA